MTKNTTAKAAALRVTRDTVYKIVEFANEVSRGALDTQWNDPGDGGRWVDGRAFGTALRVFKGKTANRQAALFYGFAAHEWATRVGIEPPAWLDALLWDLLDSPTAVTRAGDAGLDMVAEIGPRARHLTLVTAA